MEVSDALAQRLADRLTEAAAAAMGACPPGRPQLVAMIRSSFETLAVHRELFLFVSGGASEEMHQRTLFLASQSAKPMADQIAVWRKQAGLDPSAAMSWAYGVVGLLNIVSLWWLNESDLTAECVAEQVADLLWSGLAPITPERLAD